MIGLIYFSGYEKFVSTFLKFRINTLILVIVLSLLNYLMRFSKWHIYLKSLKINISVWLSLRIFFSGMLMSISPGKVGEVFKSLLLKSEKNTPILLSAPVVLMERLTDLLAIIFLSMTGFFSKDFNILTIILSIGIVIVFIIIVSTPKITDFLSSLFGKYSTHIKKLFDSSRSLMKPKVMFITTLLSIGSWFMECLGFYILIRPFSTSIPLLEATYIYAICTLLGALSMLPGGLAATEAGMTYLLVQKGIIIGVAGAITFMIRLLTLWFAILLAFIFFFGTFDVKRIIKLFQNKKEEIKST